ncbi:MAG TPA: signal recognition particle protein [Gammaproteobacteria bacterium]|nr:signal recognition particle protein [Gammaproteobacteria bacterium]
MFESLAERLTRAFKHLSGGARLKEEHITATLKEVRKALLEADVALSVVKNFIHAVQIKAIGQTVNTQLSPQQHFLKLVNDELVHVMGDANVGLQLNAVPPVVILMAGLQGSGKTTTIAKLAKYLKESQRKSVAVVSADIYRPAAIDQLRTLATEVGTLFIESDPSEKPVDIVERGILQAKKQQQDVLIIDTAGRLHIDTAMMDEIKMLARVANPTEILFVVDSMTGQDAVNTARVFNEALPLTGVILTKTDGDARGGAALSIRQVTGKPIKFIGVGEKISALEPFHPERMASRILGMGDVLSLIEELDAKVDKEKAEKLAKKLQKGHGFDLNDLRDQIKQMLAMGGMASIMDKLPGMGALPQNIKAKVNDKEIIRSLAVLDSMTVHERRRPTVIANSASRIRRVAAGAGSDVQAVRKVLKQHAEMEKMMSKMSAKGGMARMMSSLKGRLPPGMMPR